MLSISEIKTLPKKHSKADILLPGIWQYGMQMAQFKLSTGMEFVQGRRTLLREFRSKDIIISGGEVRT